MVNEYNFCLTDSLSGKIYYDSGKLEEMLSLVNSSDFLKEAKTMELFRGVPPFNLLLYNDFLVLGIYGTNKKISLGINVYSDHNFLSWLDGPLSFNKSGVRILDKSGNPKEFKRRLELRTKFDWISYNPQTEVMREVLEKKCAFRNYLESMPESDELYSLMNLNGKTFVVHMKINKNFNFIDSKGNLSKGIRCEGQGVKEYNLPINQVEEKIKKENSKALIFSSPLLTCTKFWGLKEGACIANIFEEVYAEKLGFKTKREKNNSNGFNIINPN